jgi:hypothetical protein
MTRDRLFCVFGTGGDENTGRMRLKWGFLIDINKINKEFFHKKLINKGFYRIFALFRRFSMSFFNSKLEAFIASFLKKNMPVPDLTFFKKSIVL